MGIVFLFKGEFERALSLIQQAEQYFQASKSKYQAIGGPGWASLGLGKYQETEQIFRDTLQMMLYTKANVIGLDALAGMAYLKSRSGEFEQALELLYFVQNSSASAWETKEKARKLLAELAAELPATMLADAEIRAQEFDLVTSAEALLAE